MFHKVKNATPLPDYKISIQFCEGVTKNYDMELLFERIPAFTHLTRHPRDFYGVSVDVGGDIRKLSGIPGKLPVESVRKRGGGPVFKHDTFLRVCEECPSNVY